MVEDKIVRPENDVGLYGKTKYDVAEGGNDGH
jgi:hypothetical protein